MPLVSASQYQLISVNYKLVMLVNCVHVPAAETEPVKNRSVGRWCGWDTQIQIQVEWAARLASRDLPTAQGTHMQAQGQVYGCERPYGVTTVKLQNM